MKRLSSFAAAAALSFAALPAAAVTFGQPDSNAHPHVGNILYERPDGYYSCSGTMLSPTVMLTAGHCTEEAGVANVRSWVTFAPDVVLDTGCTTRKCLNRYLDNPKNGWIPATAYPHPAYDDFNQFPATFDVGVFVLDRPVSLATYGELPPIGFLETIRSAADNRFTVVGYGLQGAIKPFYSEEWTRYVGSVKLMTLESTSNAGMSAKFTNNPGTDGGTCFGDSGGPVFWKDTAIVVAVVSWGRTPCIGVDYQFRTDIDLTQDFVEDFL